MTEAERTLSVAVDPVESGRDPVSVVLAPVDPGASVVVGASLVAAAELAEAAKVVLPLAAKVGYGPLLKLPFRPSGSS